MAKEAKTVLTALEWIGTQESTIGREVMRKKRKTTPLKMREKEETLDDGPKSCELTLFDLVEEEAKAKAECKKRAKSEAGAVLIQYILTSQIRNSQQSAEWANLKENVDDERVAAWRLPKLGYKSRGRRHLPEGTLSGCYTCRE